jgi:ectoine hydroxylase-related dioxygenase (phytanoyl-CoA dioxygenase family)
MMSAVVTDIDHQIRTVTDDEVAAFDTQGWVSLPGLLSEQLADGLLSHLKQVAGIEYDELPRDHPDAAAVVERIRDKGLAKVFFMSRMHDEAVWEIVTSRALGEAAAKLTGHRPLRLLSDGVICKLPAWTEEDMGRSGAFSGATPWHQDFGPVPWDRAQGVQFWIALCEITPEMGSMQHLTGSHREPPLGNVHYAKDRDQSLEALYPELWRKYELSAAHHFRPGDVLAHHPLTVHYAQANQTDRLRWVYTSYRIPANTLYNGIPNERFDEFGFELWKPFDHPKFPIVAE